MSDERERCECGCGGITSIATRNYRSTGVLKGEHMRYLPGHGSTGARKDRINPVMFPVYGIALIPMVGAHGDGLFVAIDIEDVHLVAQYRWTVMKAGGLVYATTKIPGDRAKRVLMHRLITNVPDGMVVDHKNGNGLDNRRVNIRVCTQSENARNSDTRVMPASGYRGVGRYARQSLWTAQICVNGTSIRIGRYQSAKEAAVAYDNAARKYHGEFARLNFPDIGERAA